ncbi:HNH endonuclease [Cytobacillus pseudoceanisediminis]|jgi:A nuclease of the HNH/ENDO VII superfamily with conserved WHH|uniref:HNH endonuclease n=2 Tax=Cytobacillus TaxID=2675230 RepID=A0ABZ2ZHJ0_9BACI|nr:MULTISPECIES: HNH endonuclease [Cytobacillus]UQX53488.1 HNH endonuclease [Cytobacillus pseudoceanisediminis]
MNQYLQKMAVIFQSGNLSLTHYQPKTLSWKDFHEEISNPNPESEQSILHDMAEGVIEGASKAIEDTWEGLKSTYELGRTIMGPFSPLFLGNEFLFNRDQLLENQRKHREFYLGILNDPIGKARQALDMPKYIWSAVSSAWERDVINGSAKSRTAFFTYGLTSLGIGILGDKGIGKAGTIAKTVGQAGKGEKALSIYTPVQTPAMAGGRLAQGPVPYNVLNDPFTKIKAVTDDVFGVKGTGKSNLEVQFTKEQLATKPSYSPAPDKWTKKGGKVTIDEDGTWVYTNKKGQTVRYPDGYPDFTEYAHPTVKPVEIEIANPTNRPLDYKNANVEAGLSKDSDPPVPALDKPPVGYIWHHHQNGKTMILVDKDIHRQFTHTGGVSTVNGKK